MDKCVCDNCCNTHTYRSWDKKTREQVPETDEEGHNNCSNLIVWCQSYSHHSIQCEVQKAHEYEVVEPQKVFKTLFKPNHPVENNGIG